MLFKEWTGSRQEWKANWPATILFHEFNQKFVNWQTQGLTGKQRRINKLDIYLPGKAKRNFRLIKCEVWGKGKKWELCLCLKLEQLSEPFSKMWTPGVRRGFSGQNKTLCWYAWIMPRQCQEEISSWEWHIFDQTMWNCHFWRPKMTEYWKFYMV